MQSTIGVYRTVTSNGDSGVALLMPTTGRVLVACIVLAIDAGASIQLVYEAQVGDRWVPIATTSAQTTVGTQTTTGTPSIDTTGKAIDPSSTTRLRWTVSGGGATFAGTVVAA